MDNYIPKTFKILGILMIMFIIYFFSHKIFELNQVKYEKRNNIEYAYDLVLDDLYDIEKFKTKEEYEVLDVFEGSMTGYGPDCHGCSGNTASGYDLRNGNITYYDEEYKEIRILAADPKYKIGTVIRVSGLSIYEEPFLAIVLDRGGRIKGNLMDLAFDSESNPLISKIGYSKNITYEILRYGW